jgi:hypothetical protein
MHRTTKSCIGGCWVTLALLCCKIQFWCKSMPEKGWTLNCRGETAYPLEQALETPVTCNGTAAGPSIQAHGAPKWNGSYHNTSQSFLRNTALENPHYHKLNNKLMYQSSTCSWVQWALLYYYVTSVLRSVRFTHAQHTPFLRSVRFTHAQHTGPLPLPPFPRCSCTLQPISD